MSIALTDTDPNLVAEMTNRLAEIFIEHTTRLKNEGITSKRQILENQLKIAEQQLAESDRALKQYKERYSTYLDPNAQSQTNELASLQNQHRRLTDVISTLNDLLAKKDEEESVATNGGSEDFEESSTRFVMIQVANLAVFDNDATMLVYRQQLKDLENTWNNIATRYTPENPKAKETLAEIKQLHKKIESRAQAKIVELKNELATVTQESKSLDGELKQLPTQELQLSELTRNNKVL
ncbi:hypothetical protein GWO43_21490, partial [candidate division KSB1 bacterium]|nr:hypothetical protein [candidate division KSB1 bacterium]NIR72167.1 hypothetical protein [candidate division KSB1 bacterium]NIS26632.1 hypothetical protein [candidate division KSB1 bacterium]NIT73400.1 hypothetical protein [candidate division KSB1 bacterium]NIU27248.1 hypothetical protein [candidate division KSB1 bacterium]